MLRLGETVTTYKKCILFPQVYSISCSIAIIDIALASITLLSCGGVFKRNASLIKTINHLILTFKMLWYNTL